MGTIFFERARDKREGKSLLNARPHPQERENRSSVAGDFAQFIVCPPRKGISRIEPLNQRGICGSAGTLAGEIFHGQHASKGAGAPRFMVRASVQLILFLLCAWLGQSLFAAEAKFSNTDCLDCHLDPATTRKVGDKVVPLIVPTNHFNKSIHAKLDCIDCHEGIKDLVHESKLPPPNCAGCHEKEGKDYATSIHGVSHQLGASGAANCWSCHGSHDIGSVKLAD